MNEPELKELLETVRAHKDKRAEKAVAADMRRMEKKIAIFKERTGRIPSLIDIKLED